MITLFCISPAFDDWARCADAALPSPPLPSLADQLLEAFHEACDERAGEIAWSLLIWLVEHVERPSHLPVGIERRAKVRFPGAQERLRNLPLTREDWMKDREPLCLH